MQWYKVSLEGLYSMKTLVFIRHAHRDKIPGQNDNGLSEKGWVQAADTANALLKRSTHWSAPPKLMTSPKLRCVETSDTIASVLKVKSVVDEDLDEAASKESGEEFIARIKDFLARWKRNAAPVTLACSHGDWIPDAIRILTGKDYDIRKGAYIEVVLEDGEAEITHQRDPEITER